MRKYPVGIQSFKEIREGKYLYVDKTRLVHTLIESGKYFFLSRPRRFGKSLLISTIKEIFSGKKDLFKGLWIEDQWSWERKHPVIHLRFSKMPYEIIGLELAISQELDRLAAELGFSLIETNIKDKFTELISKAGANERVVILIDEYDKPIIDFLDNVPKAEENREIFRSFYSVLKDADDYIRFLLITGVSRFSKVSIFSGLNNIEDISLAIPMNDLVGITQAELEVNFKQELEALAERFNMGYEEILAEVKFWYNGYSWRGENTLYNPFSLLLLVKQQSFDNFWFETGTPTFLVKALKKQRQYEFDRVKATLTELGSFDLENPVSEALLFQTGYLTIKTYHPKLGTCELGYPNKEVEQSLKDALLSTYREVFPKYSSPITEDISEAFINKDLPKLIRGLNTLISTIPYDHWKAESESVFHIIFHLALTKLGVDVRSEAHSANGRCDVVVQTATYIYVLELKLNGSAQEALDQIIEKKYLQPFQSDVWKKYAIGINFSAEKRAVDDYLMKEVF
jgi:hypothetical protein